MRPLLAILAALITSYLLFSPARIYIVDGCRFSVEAGQLLVWQQKSFHTQIDVLGTFAILAAFLFPLGMLYIVTPRITATIYRHRKAILITFSAIILFLVCLCAWAIHEEATKNIRYAPNPYLKP